jgi:chaperone required for assembly of F1-ATPase
MAENKLYTIVKGEHDAKGQMIRVKPSQYLLSLKAHEAIDELQTNVRAIAKKLEDFSKTDMDLPENIEKVRDLVFELEIAQGYLAEVFKAWQARHGQKAQGPPTSAP